MSLVDPFEGTMLHGEHEWLSRIVADPLDDDQKLVYADWLEEHGSDRAGYLRKLVAASKSMQAGDLPKATKLPKGWIELVGGRLITLLCKNDAAEIREKALKLARPALRMNKDKAKDAKIPVGASKTGGLPDFRPFSPGGRRWPKAG